MRPSLQVREFLDRYQQRLQLEFISRKVGLEREIQLSRQAADTFDAADYFNVIRTSSVVLVGYQESRYFKMLDFNQIKALRSPLATRLHDSYNQRLALDCVLIQIETLAEPCLTYRQQTKNYLRLNGKNDWR